MLRRLFSRAWAGALVLALVFAVAAVLLGNWQYSKHVERVANRDRVEAHYDAAPVALQDVLTTDRDLTEEQEWTRVSVAGRYLTDEQLMVRNRPYDGTFGYEVLVPLAPDDGSPAVLVNRGWVPNAEDAATLPDVPAPPEDQVTVTGWLRPGEPSLGRSLPQGQLASINVPEAQAAMPDDTTLLGGYLVLGEEDPEAERPRPLASPRTDLGPHFAYALQWWLTSPVGFVLVYVFVRRDHLDALAAGGDGDWTRDATARPPRPKKVRIWDEEDG